MGVQGKNGTSPLYIFYAFAVGVSWAATFVLLMWIAWGYQQYQWRKEENEGEAEDPPAISQTYLQAFLRIGFGIANMGNVVCGNSLCSSISFGVILGIVVSVFCVEHDLHNTLFRWDKKKRGGEKTFYSVMILLIVAIFVVILRVLNITAFEMFALIGG